MTHSNHPKTKLSIAVRAFVAVAVVSVLAAVWTQAGQASHLAVQEAEAAMNRSYVTLPRVEVAGKREPAAAPVAVRTGRRPVG